MTELLMFLSAIVLVAACAVFVAAEFSLIAVNRTAVEHLAAKGDRPAQGVVVALKSLSTQLSGAQVGITVTNLAIGIVSGDTIIGLLLATAGTMVFGELIPKNIALAKPMGVARRVVGFQRLFSEFMKFPIKFLNGTANFLVRRLGVEPQEELASARSADELSSLVRRSAEKGMLPKETALMLERSLAFGELTALDIMTPRVRMRYLQADAPVSGIIALAQTSGLSRFPIIRKNLDDVVGIVHIKHAVAVPHADRDKTPVERIMRPPIAVPASIQLDPLMETLRKGGLQMAVVIDEFGGTDGVVTFEDLIEELVGEVQDEHDPSGSAIRKRSGGGWAVSGLLRPDEIGEELGIFLPDEDEIETIGGLVSHRLERIPVVGDEAELEAVDREGNTVPVKLKVERMDGRRVDRVRMEVTK